jgi:hypothetical protein
MRVLAAAAPCSGRAVIIYAEVHPLRHYSNPRVEARFLRRLADVLPPGARPIIVTDAGFRAPWIRQVLKLGWDFVARIRGRAYVRRAGGEWIRFDELYDLARLKARDLGRCLVTRYQPYSCRVVVVRKRRRRWRASQRRVALDNRVRQEVQGAREPWVLATSVEDDGPESIVATYATRMQIEETFRDAKSSRFGWAMDAACTARPQRRSPRIPADPDGGHLCRGRRPPSQVPGEHDQLATRARPHHARAPGLAARARRRDGGLVGIPGTAVARACDMNSWGSIRAAAFFRDVPVLAELPVLLAEPGQLLLLGGSQRTRWSLAPVHLRLLHPAPHGGLGQVEIAGHLAGGPAAREDLPNDLGLELLGEATPLPPRLPWPHIGQRIRPSFGVHETGSSPQGLG